MKNITIELDSKITSTEAIISTVLNFFKKQSVNCKVISKSSIPVFQVNNEKYCALITNKVGSLAGVQEIKLKPYNS